jgi:hypothetical protein
VVSVKNNNRSKRRIENMLGPNLTLYLNINILFYVSHEQILRYFFRVTKFLVCKFFFSDF